MAQTRAVRAAEAPSAIHRGENRFVTAPRETFHQNLPITAQTNRK
jgi:hypothetical protein